MQLRRDKPTDNQLHENAPIPSDDRSERLESPRKTKTEDKPTEDHKRIIPVGPNGMNIWENLGLKEIEGKVYENILEEISKDIVASPHCRSSSSAEYKSSAR